MDLSNAEFGFSANVNILKRQESVANLSQFVSFSAFLNKMSLSFSLSHFIFFCFVGKGNLSCSAEPEIRFCLCRKLLK